MNAIMKQLDERIARYDLLCHPFYQAWSKGQLTRADLRAYATQYFHQVNAFPQYLATFEGRLQDDPQLRPIVAGNRAEELGADLEDGRPHAELWLDFAEGMGADRQATRHCTPLPEIQQLMEMFYRIASEGSPVEALAAFYAYESQVPRVATEKARGLKDLYAADQRTCGYFTHHQTADICHSQVWSQQLEQRAHGFSPELHRKALDAGEKIAQALWQALDGIECDRLARAA